MASLQLFCLPYSGASAMLYSRWRRVLPEWLSVQPVELPGRGARLREALQTDMQALARQLAQEILPRLDRPYALFGHSLGALLAFEMAHVLREAGAPLPVALIASGTAAPTRREDYEQGFSVPKSDEELKADLRDLQGTPEEVLENQELMELTLPILRADFLMCGLYRYRARPPLQCPLHVLGGKDDRASQEQLIAWQLESDANFSLDMLPGGHFFIHEQQAKVLRILKACLEVGRRRQLQLAG
ncbi:surfactin synthase thioesterase subunit [Pseudomonas sp. JUb42]|jgi:surfactin synthase thioesterase subunit|uniref:thioesterase II family protein n=1 Tax=Pseudomonas sp. JUb42 TaxID=2940611 RepID=UPI002169B1EB|nr:alpha/beta fold hydrolase [Pseudomonas sp. JUb42]MCS3473074.1 surfactin synthase thioesterase subunit [Pseudomonas sp. JUb42]